MVQIIDDSPKNFCEDIKRKKLFLFGAGKRAVYLCNIYGLKDRIEAVIDNKYDLSGRLFEYENKCIPIVNVNYFTKYVKDNGIGTVVLLVTPVYYGMSIIEQLDAIPELDGLRCYLGRMLDDYYEKKYFPFSTGKAIIPKKIHYCWFGGKDIPQHLQKYIDEWRERCPDYEIIRWDETNYDISKNQYMKEAYECKKWGFVPDYARLDIIYNEGGIYLDTDVELLLSMDNLLNDQMFCGFNCYGLISMGLGFGAAPKNEFVKELRDIYVDKSFYNTDGTFNQTACSWYQHPVFLEHGFKLNNEYQKIDGIVVYPSEVLAPTGGSGIADNFTNNTVAIHHAELSWVTEQEKEEYERMKSSLRRRLRN